MEVAGADDLLLGEGTEDARNDLVGGVFVVLLKPIILRDFLPDGGVSKAWLNGRIY